MKESSTNQKWPPELERLITDADIRPELLPYLKAVGFDVVSVYKVKVNIQDDCAIAKYSRRYKRIVVCHDRHNDSKTRYRLYHEMYSNGGRMIEIGGPPKQHELTSLGKILVHREDWVNYFNDNDGIVVVTKGNPVFKQRKDLLKGLQQFSLSHPSMPTIALKAPRKISARRSQKLLPPGQSSMLDLGEIEVSREN